MDLGTDLTKEIQVTLHGTRRAGSTSPWSCRDEPGAGLRWDGYDHILSHIGEAHGDD